MLMSEDTTAGPVDGRVEAVEDGYLVGWAWRPGSSAAVEVEVLIDGASVGVLRADSKRGDLRRAGIGAGRHGFVFTLPAGLEEGEHDLLVEVLPERIALPSAATFAARSGNGRWSVAAPEREQLAQATVSPAAQTEPGPQPGTPLGPPSELPARAAVQPVAGLIEELSAGVLSGWVRTAGAAAPKVAVYANGVEIGHGIADVERSDLDDDLMGFRVRLPDSLLTMGPQLLTLVAGDRRIAVAPSGWRRVGNLGDRWAQGAVHLAHLTVTPDPASRAVVGRDGWLFRAEEAGATTWNTPLSSPELDALTARLTRWRQDFDRLGVPYVLAVLPARDRLESDRLPVDVAVPGSDGPLAQLRLAAHRSVSLQLLDLLPILSDLRQMGEVLLRTDPGMTDRAAFYVARTLIKEAAKRLPRLTALPSEHLTLARTGFRGAFAGQAKLAVVGTSRVELPVDMAPFELYGESTDRVPVDVLTATRAPSGAHLLGQQPQATVYQHADASAQGTRALLLGVHQDDALMMWLAECFPRLTVIPTDEPSLEAVELETPGVAIHVLREDELRDLLPGDATD
jgi:hypothetical protein